MSRIPNDCIEFGGRTYIQPIPRITPLTVPNLYGGYVHPGSASATSLTLLVSRRNGSLGQPYRVLQFDGINP
ncbi:DUF4185 domain-containing protein [Streptomyces sp. RLB1-33]|nr:DUF4185 domain-containing protein [Streptomyces sp. RLB1-33]